jgi:hypothetical protein
MKAAITLLALCVFAQSALAAGPDCRAIEDNNQRLTCFDAASPPRIKKPATIEMDAPRAEYKDPFLVEDARTTARLKGICRGC